MLIRLATFALVLLLPGLLWAAPPKGEVAETLRACGASMCESGRAIVMSVGRERWTAGNEGLKTLRKRMHKPVSLNLYPIDKRPLTNLGLEHIAAIPATQRIRFMADSVDANGLALFVKLANKNANRSRWLVFQKIELTDQNVTSLCGYKGLTRLDLLDTSVSSEI